MTTRFPKARKPHIQASKTPCVFCGGQENQLSMHCKALLDGTPIEPLFHVTCKQCNASGSMAKSAEEAIKAWARRAPPRLVEEEPPAPDGIEADDYESDEEAFL